MVSSVAIALIGRSPAYEHDLLRDRARGVDQNSFDAGGIFIGPGCVTDGDDTGFGRIHGRKPFFVTQERESMVPQFAKRVRKAVDPYGVFVRDFNGDIMSAAA